MPPAYAADYYAQRANAGLIITEATNISPQGVGNAYTPGIWSDAQVEAWAKVTAAVHRNDGRIVMQLWHMGRMVHPSFLGGAAPVSASATMSAVAIEGGKGPAEALKLETIPTPAPGPGLRHRR